jgi:lysophospholipase L1-like esterase
MVDLYVGAMREVVAKMKLPFRDAHAVWKKWEREINFLLANGINHPGEKGNQLIADLLFAKLVEASKL